MFFLSVLGLRTFRCKADGLTLHFCLHCFLPRVKLVFFQKMLFSVNDTRNINTTTVTQRIIKDAMKSNKLVTCYKPNLKWYLDDNDNGKEFTITSKFPSIPFKKIGQIYFFKFIY